MAGTFIYDGDCAFCSSCARFMQRWIPTEASIEPWQFADLDSLGVTVAECDNAVQWVVSGRATLAGPDAIAGLLRSSHLGWRPVGWLLAWAPVRWVAWPVYRWVSKNRHRMPGGTAACAVPHAEREQG